MNPELSNLTSEVRFKHPVQDYRLSGALYELLARRRHGLSDGEVTTSNGGFTAFLVDESSCFISVQGNCTRLTISVESDAQPRNRHALKKLYAHMDALLKALTRALAQVQTPLPN